MEECLTSNYWKVGCIIFGYTERATLQQNAKVEKGLEKQFLNEYLNTPVFNNSINIYNLMALIQLVFSAVYCRRLNKINLSIQLFRLTLGSEQPVWSETISPLPFFVIESAQTCGFALAASAQT